MKKLYLLIVIMIIGFTSCVNNYHDAPQNEFIVDKVLPRDGMKSMTTYRVTMLDASGIGSVEFWMVDSIGKYKVGDRLLLQKGK